MCYENLSLTESTYRILSHSLSLSLPLTYSIFHFLCLPLSPTLSQTHNPAHFPFPSHLFSFPFPFLLFSFLSFSFPLLFLLVSFSFPLLFLPIIFFSFPLLFLLLSFSCHFYPTTLPLLTVSIASCVSPAEGISCSVFSSENQRNKKKDKLKNGKKVSKIKK